MVSLSLLARETREFGANSLGSQLRRQLGLEPLTIAIIVGLCMVVRIASGSGGWVLKIG